jgi:prevent-host-death family protein
MQASNIKPISYLKRHTAEVVSSVSHAGPVVITQNGEARAIVVDVKSYERMQNALLLLKMIAQSQESIRRGRWKTHETVAAELRNRLGR